MFQAVFFDTREKRIQIVNSESTRNVTPKDFPEVLKEALMHYEITCPREFRTVDGVDTLQVYVMPLHPAQLASYQAWYGYNEEGSLSFYRAESEIQDSEGNVALPVVEENQPA